MQPTALVHEAWLRLVGDGDPGWQNRAHFFGAAAEAMRRILIDRARRKQALRHGGGQQRVELEESALEAPADDEKILQVHSRGSGAGPKIGRYKLLQQIGEGGMGVVYMAEQEEPVRRKVALKIIKLGMDTKQVIARFEAERQALALMDHPNIAKVLDAGATESGRPYFVMELVRGMPITELLRREQSLHARAARIVHASLPGHSARASEGHHPPRHQAVEHPGDAARRRAGAEGD